MAPTGRFKPFASFVGKASAFKTFFQRKQSESGAAPSADSSIMSLIGDIKATYTTEEASASHSNARFAAVAMFGSVATHDAQSEAATVLELAPADAPAIFADEDILELG